MSCPIHGVQGPKRNIVVAQLAEAFLKEHPEKRRPKDDTDRLDQLSAKLLDGLKKDEVPAPNRQQTNLRPTPTTHNQQPTTNNQRPTTNNQQTPNKKQTKKFHLLRFPRLDGSAGYFYLCTLVPGAGCYGALV